MIPYPEPYQSMYQHRRLAALGIDWQPSSLNLTVGTTDNVVYGGVGDNPLNFNLDIEQSPHDDDRVQLDSSMRWVEQPIDIDEAMDWDQEAARLTDDAGSDYTASDVSLSDIDEEVSVHSSEESINSEEAESKEESTQEFHLRRSGRNKWKAEGLAVSTSRRQMRRREVDSQRTCAHFVDGTAKPSAGHRQDSRFSVARPTSQLCTRPKRLAAKNALQLFSHISSHEEDDVVHMSRPLVRSFGHSERVYKPNMSLKSNALTDELGGEGIPEDEPDGEEIPEEFEEEYKLKRELSSKFEPSEFGEFTRRPRSHRRYFLNSQDSVTRISDSHCKGSQELQVDVLPLRQEPLLRAEESDVVPQRSAGMDRNQKTMKRVVIRHPRLSVQHLDFEGSSDFGDDGGDSNDIANVVETLKRSHSDELQSPESYGRSQSEEKMPTVHREIENGDRNIDDDSHGALDPLDGSDGSVSCSSDGSAINYKERRGALGKPLQIFVGGTSQNVEASCVHESVMLGSSRAFAGKDLGREFMKACFETKAHHSCMEKKPSFLTGVKWPPDPPKLQSRKGVNIRQGITRSGTGGRSYMPGKSKEFIATQNTTSGVPPIQWRVGTKSDYSGKEGQRRGGVMSAHEVYGGSSLKTVLYGSANSGIDERRLSDKGILLDEGNLEDREDSDFSRPYYGDDRDISFLNKFPRKSVIRKRGTSRQKNAANNCKNDYRLVKTGAAIGIVQTAAEECEQIRPDVSGGNSQRDFLQDHESWTESESDEGSAKAGQNSRHNKRRTLGELHLQPVLGSTSSIHHNVGEDFVTKRRIRHMRSVMLDDGREGAIKRVRGRKTFVTKNSEIPGMNSKCKRTRIKYNQWLVPDVRGRDWLVKNKDIIDGECARTLCMEVSAESNKLQATELDVPEEGGTSVLNERRVLRASSRLRRYMSRRETSWDRDHGRFTELHLLGKERAIRSRKSSDWLMLSEVDGTRYIPQFGDHVVYLRQGHQEFLDSYQKFEHGPWTTYGNLIQAVEFCRVTDLDYAILSDSGDTFCRLTLEFSNQASKVFGKSFMLSLPELTNFPDFLVEKNRYDAAIQRNWTSRDRCQVWWRSEDGKGGSWWDGRVTCVKPKSSKFPDSPWERYVVQYRGDTSGPQTHSPWELFDSKCPKWEPPYIDKGRKTQLSSVLDKLEFSADEPEDPFGIRRLRHLACKADYINRVPLPLTLDIIKLRLEKDYYRSLEAFFFDVHVLDSNAKRYFGTGSEMSEKMAEVANCISESLSYETHESFLG